MMSADDAIAVRAWRYALIAIVVVAAMGCATFAYIEKLSVYTTKMYLDAGFCLQHMKLSETDSWADRWVLCTAEKPKP